MGSWLEPARDSLPSVSGCDLYVALTYALAGQRCCTKALWGVPQTLDLSALELLDPFMPSLDITVKYCRGHSPFPENLLMSRIP